MLLAATGVAVGAVSTAILAGSWSPNSLTFLGAHLWWTGVVAASVGIAALGYSVFPRTKRSGPAEGPIFGYYADMANITSDELASLIRAAGKNLDDRLVDQLGQISKIVVRNYRGVRLALWSLAIAALLCAISTVVG
ncbi:Pycsar system effector family protein [Curtobacterium sp. ER1/6]|uniref:Pycsar system effector family protein n=1 Tax=Curtobacterium sp. ER1/6 TaxID=1891920 RepID=UPI001CB93866